MNQVPSQAARVSSTAVHRTQLLFGIILPFAGKGLWNCWVLLSYNTYSPTKPTRTPTKQDSKCSSEEKTHFRQLMEQCPLERTQKGGVEGGRFWVLEPRESFPNGEKPYFSQKGLEWIENILDGKLCIYFFQGPYYKWPYKLLTGGFNPTYRSYNPSYNW